MPDTKWFKGNIHTHTSGSDGDASPLEVAQLYKQHEYDFLVLSDHDVLTVLDAGGVGSSSEIPLLIPGEEVSIDMKRPGQENLPLHLNGIGISRQVAPIDTGELVSTLQANVDALREAGGIVSLNHPNFHWAYNAGHILKVNGAVLLEIFNGIGLTNTLGAPGWPGAEEIWDGVLTKDKIIWGVAADDAHHYQKHGPVYANPFRGWVVVNATELTQSAILHALAAGHFYSSSGVIIRDIDSSDGSIHLAVEQEAGRVFGNVRDWDQVYKFDFIGSGGKILAQVVGEEATYCVRGDEGYVRVRITGSSGTRAWTQPVFIGPK